MKLIVGKIPSVLDYWVTSEFDGRKFAECEKRKGEGNYELMKKSIKFSNLWSKPSNWRID